MKLIIHCFPSKTVFSWCKIQHGVTWKCYIRKVIVSTDSLICNSAPKPLKVYQPKWKRNHFMQRFFFNFQLRQHCSPEDGWYFFLYPTHVACWQQMFLWWNINTLQLRFSKITCKIDFELHSGNGMWHFVLSFYTVIPLHFYLKSF